MDISQRKRADEERRKLEAQLRQSQKIQAIGTLAGGIAHDFNNILWVIMGNAELCRRKMSNKNKLGSKLNEIIIASKRAKSLIEQILTFSRQNEDKKKPVGIHLIIKETLHLIKATLPSRIRITQNIRNCGNVLADPVQIHQMVMNLCTNAAHAIGEDNGIIHINLRVVNVDSKFRKKYPELFVGDYVQLTVNDSGCGISPETLERIFEPFFTTKEVGKGTGLGLATVHGIVSEMSGKIHVESQPGRGTSFHIFLPMHETYGESTSIEAQNTLLEKNPRKARILVVDDEPQVAEVVAEMLEDLGFETASFTSSVLAFKEVTDNPDKYTLIITDQMMPDMSGLEMTRQLQSIQPDLPVILTSGFSNMLVEEELKVQGIKEYLKKPILFSELQESVFRIINNTEQ
jgi:nitrogen-specific signal transduction histidine kinase/CheY-like chemotaxis protein